ncbi:MAG: cytochrome b [Alphaproteobacteria bacterium]|nr:cytochrome b [Alphaproteobacteria bacterium]
MKSAVADASHPVDEAVARRRYAVRQYRMPAKVFHWLTAVLIVFMVSTGVIAKQLSGGPAADLLFGLHKLFGAVTLAVLALRVGYRLFRSLPPHADQPQSRPMLHWTLYAVVILVPLLGWAGVSDFGARDAAFGIVLPAIWPEGLGYDALLLKWHAYAAFALLALVVLHIGIAIQDYMTADRPPPHAG